MFKHFKKMLVLCSLLFTCTLTGCQESELGLVIELECNYSPFNWTTNKESDFTLPVSNKFMQYADGYDIQIAKKIGEQLNTKVIIVKSTWDSLIPDLQTYGADLVIAGMTDTPERRMSIDFTDEYYRSELVLIVKKEVADKYSSPLSDSELNELIHGKICVSQAFTVTDDVLDIFKEKYQINHASPLKDFASAADDISRGQSFAMTAEYPVAQAIVGNKKDLGIIRIDQEILGDKASELGVSIGVAKGNQELIDKVNSVLDTISQDERNELMVDAVARSTTL